jgi:hypothetical protein
MEKNDKINVLIGFDISTTCIGISVFNSSTGDFIELNHIKLDVDKKISNENRYLYKANLFKEYINKYKIYNITHIIVEDPLQGSNNIMTVNQLLRFNGICCYILYQELNIEPTFITIHNIRKTVCPEMVEYDKKGNGTLKFKSRGVDPKEYIFEKINKYFPDLKINWLYNRNNKLKSENYDMSDSMAVSLAYLVENKIIKF